MDQPVLCTLRPSAVRRVAAVATLAAVALLLLWIAVQSPPRHPGWLLVVVATGAGLLGTAARLWQRTDRCIVLTRAGLFDGDGTCIASMADIEAVDRSAFAFKPSGGFVLRLARAPGRAWVPGLWWRLGHRLGVGGVTGNMQGRAMAEMIAVVLTDRDGALHGSAPDA